MGIEQDILNFQSEQARVLGIDIPYLGSVNFYKTLDIDEFEFLDEKNTLTIFDAYQKKLLEAKTLEEKNDLTFAYTVLINPELKVMHDYTLNAYSMKNFKPQSAN